MSASDGKSDDVISLIRHFKKSGITLSDMSLGLEMHSISEKNGLGKDNSVRFMKLLSALNSKKIDPEKFIDSAMQFFNIHSDSDLTLDQLPSFYDSLNEKYANLQNEHKQLCNDISQEKKNLDATLQSNNTKYEQLQKFTDTAAALENESLEIDEYDKMAYMIKTAKNQGYDVEKILLQLQKEDTHENRITQYEQTIQSQSSKIESINETLSDIESKLDETEQKLSSVENKYKTERTAILFVKKLQKLGISQGRIVQWNDIFEDSGIDVESFAKQVDKMSFLQKLSENKKESIAKLNQDIGQLGVKKSELLLQTKKLQSKRDELLDLQKIITKLLRNSAQDYRLVLQSSNNIVFNNLANTVTKELEQIITHTDKLLHIQK